MQTVAVIIPIYQKDLSLDDKIALDQCFRVLKKHPIIAIKPQSLDVGIISEQYPFAEVISFADPFFSGISGYNNLMTSKEFYGAFLNYQFILIHQLDAFVFEDSLLRWCSQNFDYLGAPWLWDKDYLSKSEELKFRIKQNIYIFFNKKDKNTGLPVSKQFRDRVGNGGLSLRNVSKFYELIQSNLKTIDFYNKNTNHHFYNEDIFWSIEINRRSKKLNIPSYRTAIFFGMENELEKSMRLTNGKLPFGCHDWDRNRDFWRPYFLQCGYVI